MERFVTLAREQAPNIAVSVMLAAYLGTRRGETLALRWCDLDADAGEITVRQAVTQTPTYGVAVKTTKTRKQRVIPLDADTLATLKTVQREQREQRMALGKAWQGAKDAHAFDKRKREAVDALGEARAAARISARKTG